VYTLIRNTMTPRERVIRALNFEKADRVATYLSVPGQYYSKFESKYGANWLDYFKMSDLDECIPLLAWPSSPGKTVDGVFWFTDNILKDYSKAHELIMPDPRAAGVFDNLYRNLKANPDSAKVCNIFGPFTILHACRNVANLYSDVLEYPDELHALIKRVMDIQTDIIRQAVKLPVDIIYFQDDIASTRGLIMSPQMIKEFILDYFEEGIAIAKKAGKKVAFHSDGNVTDILDDLCKMGVDAINPMQISCNDFDAFRRNYGGKMAVFGGIDNSFIIPNGTPEQIVAHVENLFKTFGYNGGLIMATHEIRGYVPFESYDALFYTMQNCRY